MKITNRAKDYFIEQLKSERERIIEKLMISSHKVGELETKLLQLDLPKQKVGAERNVKVEGVI